MFTGTQRIPPQITYLNPECIVRQVQIVRYFIRQLPGPFKNVNALKGKRAGTRLDQRKHDQKKKKENMTI